MNLLQAEGLRARTPAQIRSKIGELEKQFRDAVDWSQNTGQGIRENDHLEEAEKEGQIRAYILKLCPYWDMLQPIMGDRHSSWPMASNEDDHDNFSRNDSGNVSVAGSEVADARSVAFSSVSRASKWHSFETLLDYYIHRSESIDNKRIELEAINSDFKKREVACQEQQSEIDF